jgi:DNA-binding response OmpR family regulator
MVTVLIIEDNFDLADTLREILEDEGFACWLEGDAGEALRRLLTAPHPPDAILADLDMPGMPLAELVRLVRASASLSRVPIVLMTGVMESSIPAYLSVDAIQMKPFKVEELLETLRSLLSQGSAHQDASSP